MRTISETTDIPGTTASGTTLDAGDRLAGTLSPGTDTDWIQVTLEAGRGYTALVDTEISGAGLRLRDSDGRQATGLIHTVLDAGRGFTILGDEHTTGTYFLEVWSLRDEAAGDYTLSLTSDVAFGPTSVTRLQPGETVEGIIDYVADVDWWGFEVEPGRGYGVVVEIDGTAQVTTAFYDEAGTQLTRDIGTSANVRPASEQIAPDAPGLAFFEVEGLLRAPAVGPYTISLFEEEAPSEQSDLVLVPGAPVEGRVDFQFDRDWIGVDLVRRQEYGVRLETPGQDMAGLSLLHTSANGFVRNLAPDADGIYTFTATETGRNFLQVVGNDQPVDWRLTAVAGDFAAQGVEWAGQTLFLREPAQDLEGLTIAVGQVTDYQARLMDSAGVTRMALLDIRSPLPGVPQADGALTTAEALESLGLTELFPVSQDFAETLGLPPAVDPAPIDPRTPIDPTDPTDPVEDASLEGYVVLVDTTLGVSRPDELDGATVAVQTGTAVETALAAFFQANALSYAPVAIDDASQGVARLLSGAADVLILPEGALTQALQAELAAGSYRDLVSGDLVADLTLPDGVIRGDGGPNDILGTTADEAFEGLGGNDTLNGWAGDDTLDGGAGADLLIGGQGSDVIYVDNVGDRVAESRKWAGSDTVISSVDFRMGRKHIEDLELAGDARLGAGNGLRNTITGNDADNVLDGGKNVDTLIGGAGDDRYLIRAPGDNAVETADGGIDTVLAFRAHALDDHIENLFLQTLRNDAGQGVAGVNGIGNDLDNIIVGNPFDNIIVGREGNDTLRGQAGDDDFVFDRALGAGNVDTIVDFQTNAAGEDDRLLMKQNVFAGVVKGGLADGAFVAGRAAQDANDRFIFDQGTGRLWFDIDGRGGAAQQLVATFERGAEVTADDIFLI